MGEYATATIGDSFDGPIDDGIERRVRSDSVSAEAAAHAILRLVADKPARIGRLRAARIVAGLPVPYRDADADGAALERYAVELSWPIREVVALIDTMIDGGLLTQSIGARPTLVLTYAGFSALLALDGGFVPTTG